MKTRHLLVAMLMGLSLVFDPSPVIAGDEELPVLVVVSHSSGVRSIEREDLINLYMGRYRRLSSGDSAIPVDFAPAKKDFYKQLIAKSLPEVNAYWARLVFSGRASPPLQIEDINSLLEFVAANKGAIAYVYASDLASEVRPVASLRSGDYQTYLD